LWDSIVAAATIIGDLKSLTMNYYLAVFNCHIKDAEQAACGKFISIREEKKFNTIVDLPDVNVIDVIFPFYKFFGQPSCAMVFCPGRFRVTDSD